MIKILEKIDIEMKDKLILSKKLSIKIKKVILPASGLIILGTIGTINTIGAKGVVVKKAIAPIVPHIQKKKIMRHNKKPTAKPPLLSFFSNSVQPYISSDHVLFAFSILYCNATFNVPNITKFGNKL